jgi:hypothetical protein
VKLCACFLLSGYTENQEEKRMPQTMTLDEKLAISNKALDLLDAGDREWYDRLIKSVPMPRI